MSQSYYKDKDGNLIHTRIGNMIKRRVEVNKFTGEGELVDVESKHSKPKKKKEKKEKKSKVEILLKGLNGLELDIDWAITIFDSFIQVPKDNKKNIETLLANLGTLKSDVDTVIAFVEKLKEEKKKKKKREE